MHGYCDVFFLRIILKRTSTEAHVYMQRHQGAKFKHFDVSNVIYPKFSYSGVSYTLNGKIVNEMLEFFIIESRIYRTMSVKENKGQRIKSRATNSMTNL